jgi:hypothetical protein
MRTALSLLGIWLLVGGCYLSHERDGSFDGSRRDAGAVIRRDGSDRDAIPAAFDAGACRPVSASTACIERDHRPFLTAGRPSELAVWSTSCHCGGELACTARVALQATPGSNGLIELFTAVCGEGRCAACTPPNEVACEIPALEEGEYQVLVNGDLSFALRASSSGGVPPTSLCQEVGSLGGGLCDFPGALMSWRPERVCFSPSHGGDRFTIDFEAETSCALEPGPCDVYIARDRGVGHLEVRPRVRSCDEGSPTWGCTGSTGTLRRSCTALHLEPGPYTMGLQDGTMLGAFDIGAGTSDPECFDVP